MLAERLKQAREAKGLSQIEMASKIGVSQAAYCYYEQGLRIPSLGVAKTICGVLNVSLDWLTGNDNIKAEV